ncbi:MAG: sigma-70 family RNA polymerase sigma factor [Pseudomonadota bacterium]
MTEDTDQSLLRRVAEGSEEAMRALYDRHQAGMYRFVRSRLNDPFEAADAVHDAMLDVWRKAGRYKPRASVKSWMFTIARNKAIDQLRKTKRTVTADPDETVPDDALNPEQALAASQDATLVRWCLQGLSAAHRTVLQLAFFQELSYPEIAEVEDLPLGTVKTRVHHAKRLMIRCLSNDSARAG